MISLLISSVGFAQVTVPVDFEQDPGNYDFLGFEGAESAIEANPDQTGENTSGNVMRSTKTEGSAFYAGTSINLDAPIDFSTMQALAMDVWSPKLDIPVKLRLEDENNTAGIEVDMNTTTTNEWERLEYDFSSVMNPDVDYVRIVVFFEFVVDLPGDGTIYYFDNVELTESSGGGDNDGYCNTTVQHLGIPAETASAINLTIENQDAQSMIVKISSANSDPVDDLIIPGASGATIGAADFSVPGEISRTLTWDAPPADVALNVLWSKESFGGNWQLSPEDVVVPFDFVCGGGGTGVSLPLDFELDPQAYTYEGFEGADSAIETNPDQSGTNTSANVMRTIKTDGALFYAGTSITLDEPVQFTSTGILEMDIWSPKMDIPIKLRLEDADNTAGIEVDVNNTTTNGWETLQYDFSGVLNPDVDYVKVIVFFEFIADLPGDGTTYYFDNIRAFEDMSEVITLPLDFEFAEEEYDYEGFEGADSAIETNPDQSGENTSENVMRTIKTDGSQFYAGTFVNLDEAIDFSENTALKMDVWSPKLDIPVRMRLENADNSVGVELDVNTTTQNEWETLTYDFTSMLTPGVEFVRIVVFFEFVDGLPGDGTTYYYDNIELTEGSGGDLLFCNTTVQHLGIPAETASAINLTIENVDANSMIVTISSANSDPVDLLIVNNGSGATISEEDLSVPGEISRTLTWTDPPTDVVLNILWSKVSFEGNWQLSPMEISVPFNSSCDGLPDQIDLPVTFEDENVDYSFGDFEGAASMLVEDPTDASNTVAQTIRTDMAGTFAGTVIGVDGFANPIPFAAPLDTKLSVRVWSPEAGIPVRLKVENALDPGIYVETETNTTVAETWETLEFDFGANAPGSPVLNFAASYSKAIIFFNFGAEGTAVGEQTFYWDDVEFVPGAELNQVDLTVTFEDETVAYLLSDFAGAASQVVEDPTDASNTVAQTIRTDAAATFAGTTIGGVAGFANPIPFADGETFMNVRVWSPEAGIPVRLKVEAQANPTISVETQVNTTVAEGWETLEFDFSNEADGTQPINLANTYSKATIFFNFGAEGSVVGEQTYYWDDLAFGMAPEPYTVYNVIADSLDHETLELAIGEAELVDALNGTGPLTVFAPTDDAFNALPDGMLDMLLADPTGDLQEILLYHVLGEQLASTDISEGPKTTLQGEDIQITIEGTDVFINDALVTVVDLFADNGVVHVIDAVLLPPSFTDGLEELSATSAIQAWPNPATNQLNVEFLSEPFSKVQMTIYDVSGRMIEQFNPQNRLSRIDLTGYQAGQYILRIDNKGKGYYHKFIITK